VPNYKIPGTPPPVAAFKVDRAPRTIRSLSHGLGTLGYHLMAPIFRRTSTRPGGYKRLKTAGSKKRIAFPAKRRQTNGYGNVTAQHDSSLVYRRKRMPKRMKRRWRKFSKKVNWIINKNIAPCALLRRNILTRSAGGINFQVLGVASSLSAYGTANDLSDDQITILKDAALRTTNLDTQYFKQMVRISSVVLDVTFENRAYYPVALQPDVLTDMEVDIYELQCVRDVFVSDVSQGNRDIYDFITHCTNAQAQPTVGDLGVTPIGTNLNSTEIGWTPFQSAKFCKYFKVLKKTKKYMTPGGYFTYQLRNAGERILTGLNMDVATDAGGTSTATQPLMNKMTKLLLFVCKGEPLTNDIGTSFWSIPRFTLGQTKTINYRIVEKNTVNGYLH